MQHFFDNASFRRRHPGTPAVTPAKAGAQCFLLDADRYGHPVGRFHRHGGDDTFAEFP